MELFNEYLYRIVYVLTLTLSIVYLTEEKLNIKSNIKRVILFILGYTLINYLFTINNYNRLDEYLTIHSLVVLFDCIYIFCLFKNTQKENVFYVTIFELSYSLSTNILIYIINTMNLFNRDAIMYQTIERTVATISTSLITIIFIVMIKRYLIVPSKEAIKYQYNLFILLNVVIYYAMLIIAGIGIVENIIMIIVYILLIMWGVFFKVLSLYIETTIKNEELIMEEMSNKYISKYLEFCRRESDNLRKLKHDLKNHKDVLEQIDKFNNYNQYIDDIFKDIDINHIQTGNIYIDSCLYAKQEEYSDIVFDFDISVADLKINEKDITSLLFNLIDNACDEALKTNKRVKVIIKYSNNILVIKVTNKCKTRPSLISNKGFDHGYGLKIINGIIKKYDGDLNVEYRDALITFNIKINV